MQRLAYALDLAEDIAKHPRDATPWSTSLAFSAFQQAVEAVPGVACDVLLIPRTCEGSRKSSRSKRCISNDSTSANAGDSTNMRCSRNNYRSSGNASSSGPNTTKGTNSTRPRHDSCAGVRA